MDPEKLKAFAQSIGFDRLGITDASPPQDFARYEEWIKSGFAGELWYLTEPTRIEKRRDLQKVLPGARSVIVGAISYAPKENRPATDAKIARYARGRDYHAVLQERLEQLAEWLRKNTAEPFEYLTYVDTGPLLEKSLGERAGVGWIGKNTCVMHESTGSYLYLGEIITTLELPCDAAATNRCGTCTRCLDACPTAAFTGPYQLDATKCISYQTIENKSAEIPAAIAKDLHGWIAGCDICQEVCPWNREPLTARLEELSPLPHTQLSLKEIRELTVERFRELFGATSLKRIGHQNLVRNAIAAERGKNVGLRSSRMSV